MLLHIVLTLVSAFCVQGGFFNQGPSISFEPNTKQASFRLLNGNNNVGVNTLKAPISYYLPKEEYSLREAEQKNHYNSYQIDQSARTTLNPHFVYNTQDLSKPRPTVNNIYDNRGTFILKEPELVIRPTEYQYADTIKQVTHHVPNTILLNDNIETSNVQYTNTEPKANQHNNVHAFLESNSPIVLNSQNYQLPLFSNNHYSTSHLNIIPYNIQAKSNEQNAEQNVVITQNNNQILPVEQEVNEAVVDASNEPHLINALQGSSVQNAEKNIEINSNLQPIINKHFYFHVPPNDIEETTFVPANIPPKKTYNIIFIKLPRQEPIISADTSAFTSFAPIEDKTLIYVLVKKTDEVPQIALPPRKPSEHEVLFVKYKENQNDLNANKQTLLDTTQIPLSELINDQNVSA